LGVHQAPLTYVGSTYPAIEHSRRRFYDGENGLRRRWGEFRQDGRILWVVVVDDGSERGQQRERDLSDLAPNARLIERFDIRGVFGIVDAAGRIVGGEASSVGNIGHSRRRLGAVRRIERIEADDAGREWVQYREGPAWGRDASRDEEGRPVSVWVDDALV